MYFQLVFWFYLTWLLVVLLLVLQAATLRRRLIATVEEGRAGGGEGKGVIHGFVCIECPLMAIIKFSLHPLISFSAY